MAMTHVDLFADGSCVPNPGRGAYATLLRAEGAQRELTAGYVHTTNNRMELRGVLAGLEALKYPCAVTITVDSQYVVTMLKKLAGWAQMPALLGYANPDLLHALFPLVHTHQVTAKWVRGHAGHVFNEWCDALAGYAMRSGPWTTDEGYRHE